MSDQEKNFFNRLASDRGSTWWGRCTPAGRLRDAKKVQLMEEILCTRPGERILEAGCGTGEFTESLSGWGVKTTAFDIAESCVRSVKGKITGKKNIHLTVADGTVLPFRDKVFDLCVGVSILHHVNLDECWPELVRVCRPGARFFFSEPNLLNPQIFLEKKIPFLKNIMENTPEETAFIRWRLTKKLYGHGTSNLTVRNIDFIHPLFPKALLSPIEKISDFLEVVPGIKEISGSLAIFGVFQ